MVNPARGENVGFAARALKTMGFSSLRIVGEPLQHSKEARKTGYGSHDLLDNVKNYPTLEASLADVELTIGTTAKQRIKRYDYHLPEQIGEIVSKKQEIVQEVALVFGSEENGLSKEELDQCDLVSTIPLATTYPSLNLAQSMLIYAWALFAFRAISPEQSATGIPRTLPQEFPSPNATPQITSLKQEPEVPVSQDFGTDSGNAKQPNPRLQGLLKDETIQLLQSIGISDKPILAKRIMDRVMLLGTEDSELLMTLLKKLKRNT